MIQNRVFEETIMLIAPVCYRFRPTDREVIQLFLARKAMELPLPAGHRILERPLYGEQAPWDVFRDGDPWEHLDDSKKKKTIFVFSKVISKNGQSKNRTVRTAGCGTWDGKAVGKKIKDSEGNVIGYRRAFTFKPKKESEYETKGKWIMHEYSLADTMNFKDGDCVICRISTHVPKEGLRNADDGSGSDSDGSNSVEKLSKKTMNRRVRRGGGSTDKPGNQETGRVVGPITSRPSVNFSNDQRLKNQEIVRTAFAQRNENQEVIPDPVATPQYPYGSEKNAWSTPKLHDFFR